MAEYLLTFLYYCPIWIFFLFPFRVVGLIGIIHFMMLKVLNERRMIAGVIVLLSVAMIAWITLFTRISNKSQIDLMPFHFIFCAKKHPHILRAALLNIVLYIPFGYGTAEYACIKRKNLTIILLYAIIAFSKHRNFAKSIIIGVCRN